MMVKKIYKVIYVYFFARFFFGAVFGEAFVSFGRPRPFLSDTAELDTGRGGSSIMKYARCQ